MSKKNKNIFIAITPQKNFCYIDFAIELILKISLDKNSKKIYNIGSPEKDISIMQLANKISRILNSKKIVIIKNTKR